MPKNSDIPLLLFAKAPIAGKVKTRLQSHCSPEQAADIAELLLEASLQNVCTHWPGSVYLSTLLDSQHPRIQRLADQFEVDVLEQVPGNLGEKMHAAFEQWGYPLAIMGADVPHVAAHTLTALYASLQTGCSAIGPSEDGGYYIIGLTESSPHLFHDVSWGTSKVWQQTQWRAQQKSQVITELSPLVDVDEWQDLLAVAAAVPTLQAYLIERGLAHESDLNF